jgi:hypothetical protein
MRHVTFKGPGDEMAIDGLSIKKSETVELDELQIRRLRDAGAELEDADEPATPAEED